VMVVMAVLVRAVVVVIGMPIVMRMIFLPKAVQYVIRTLLQLFKDTLKVPELSIRRRARDMLFNNGQAAAYAPERFFRARDRFFPLQQCG